MSERDGDNQDKRDGTREIGIGNLRFPAVAEGEDTYEIEWQGQKAVMTAEQKYYWDLAWRHILFGRKEPKK